MGWIAGLPKKITTYAEDGHKVAQTENIYDYSKANSQMPSAGFTSCHCEVVRSSSLNINDWNAENPGSGYITTGYQGGAVLAAQIYPHYTGRVELSDTYERIYRDDTHWQETHTSYTYNPSNYNVKKVARTLSNGDIDIKETYYPIDYNVTGPLTTLKNNNIISLPVASFSSVVKKGSTQPIYLGGNMTEFTSLPNGDVKPANIIEGRSVQPVSSFIFNNTDPFNYPNKTATQFFRYKTNGLLEGSEDEGGRKTAMIYDYNDRFVTASVVNAETSEIAYTSFETASSGNWDITGGTSVDEQVNQAVTGTKSFNFGTGSTAGSISKSGLNTDKRYLITYWSNGGNINITTNGTKTIQGQVYSYKGWSLFIAEVANATSLTISGTGKIDELRLYPKGALMSTTTYDPLVGKNSECDANNRIAYYRYNAFGELEVVLDQDGNAVKTYEYRYKNRTNN